MFIGLMTLVIFIYQTNIMREQSRLSVQPILSFSIEQEFRDSIVTVREVLQNKGLGPAIIKELNIIHENTKLDFDVEKYFRENYTHLYAKVNFIRNLELNNTAVLSNGEKLILYEVTFNVKDLDQLANELSSTDSRESPINMMATYQSIYKQQWKTHNNDAGFFGTVD